MQGVSGNLERRLHGIDHLLGYPRGILGSTQMLQQYHELITAPTANAVFGAHSLLQALFDYDRINPETAGGEGVNEV